MGGRRAPAGRRPPPTTPSFGQNVTGTLAVGPDGAPVRTALPPPAAAGLAAAADRMLPRAMAVLRATRGGSHVTAIVARGRSGTEVVVCPAGSASGGCLVTVQAAAAPPE